MKRWLHLSMLVGLIVGTSGCSTPPARNWSSQEHSKPDLDLTLQPGDEVELRFFGAPELDLVQEVRRDGVITVRLLGDVVVRGMSSDELAKQLIKRIGSQLQVKEVSVQVRSKAPIYVTGSVLEPGPYSMNRPLTALDAVMEAGGFEVPRAEVRSVVVMREVAGQRKGYFVNLKPALQGEVCDPFYLKPRDVVYVPRRGIAKANDTVEMYISRMIPELPITVSSSGEVFVGF